MNLHAQDCEMYNTGKEPCHGNLVFDHCSFKDYKHLNYNQFIWNYVKDMYPNSINDLIFNKHDLKSFKCLSSTPESQIFEIKINKAEVKIEFKFSQENIIFGNDSLLNSTKFVSMLALKDSLNSNFIGNIPQDARVKYELLNEINILGKKNQKINIDNIKLKILNINRIYFSNSYKPIEVYYSPKRNKYYCYLYFLEWDGYSLEATPNSSKPISGLSDILKLIIDPDTGECNIIYSPFKYFYYYGWEDCVNFWPF